MNGFDVWVRKEVLEIALTWRRYVLPVLVLILAVFSPVMARVAPELLRSVASDNPDVVIQLPDPTATDAISQWAQSLSQIVIFAVIILAAGLVSNDLKDGTAQLALVKPLGRRAFLLAKIAVMTAFLAVVTAVGTLVCAAVTQVLFDSVPVRDLIRVTVTWLGFALVMICLLTLFSAALKSQAAAAGAGIGAYFAISIVGLWDSAVRYTPVGLLAGLSSVATGESFSLAAPLITGVLTAFVLVGVTSQYFQRQPLR